MPWTPLNLWLSHVLKHKIHYVLGILSVVMTATGQTTIPRVIGWVVDFLKDNPIPSFFPTGEKSEVYTYLILAFLGAQFILILGRMGWRWFLGRQTHHAGAWLRKKLWEHIQYISHKRLNETFTVGHLMNASTSDVNYSRFIFGFTLIGLFDALFLGIMTLVNMFTINVQLTLACLIVFPILPYLIKKLNDLQVVKHETAQNFLSDFNDQASQAVSTIRLQRLTQTGKFWERKLVDSADGYKKRRLDAVFTSFRFFPLMGSMTLFSYLVIFGFGISKVMGGELTVGQFVTMQGLIFLLHDPLVELGFIITEIQKSKASLKRLCEVYNEPPDHALVHSGTVPVKSDKIYEVKNLSFTYEGMNHPVFKDLNFELKAGERLGISGTIGTGKSTLVNIITGIEQRVEGEVNLYNRSIKEYSHESLRGYIGVVPQKPFLFADTVRNNIALDQEITEDQVWHYLEIAGLTDDVKKFPKGLETPLGEWGINLSGGQKQRLTLARALARKPEILILDDCLSAVDTVTEEKILRSLDHELKETTLIWIAHRKSTLKYCNQFLEL